MTAPPITDARIAELRALVDEWRLSRGCHESIDADAAATSLDEALVALTAARAEVDALRLERDEAQRYAAVQLEVAAGEVALRIEREKERDALSRRVTELHATVAMTSRNYNSAVDEARQAGREEERRDTLAMFEQTRVDACARYEAREHELSEASRGRVAIAIQGGFMLLDELKAEIKAGRHVGAARAEEEGDGG